MIEKTIITKIFSLSPVMKFVYALLGIFVIAAFVMITRTIITKTNISDQYDAIAVWQNNGEGNWDIAYSIYKQNDNKWIHQVDKNIYYEGDANLIAKLPGNDNDPDIASTRSKAIAVWSNTGMEGNKGADIVVSKWDSNGWSKPARLFAMQGDDVDPTVYMQDAQHALVVWVNKSGGNRTLYYSEYTNGSWSNPKNISFNNASKIATPELGYITVSSSRYLLVFTARVAGSSSAYMGSYDRVNGWNITKIKSGAQAMTDESIPAKYRTSVAMQIDSRNVAMSWSGQDGNIWYIKASVKDADLNVDAQNAGVGVNSDLMYNPKGKKDADTILFSSGGELVNITPVGGGLKQIVSLGEPSAVRADAAYLWEQGKRSAVSVWATKKEGESEIYFSAVNRKSKKWTSPKRIDSNVFAGEDANPAITPIIIQLTKENTVIEDKIETGFIYDDSFCGDKILQKQLGEECEISVACGNVDKICDWNYYTKKLGKKWAGILSDCECMTPPDKIATPDTTKKDTGKKKKEKAGSADVVYGGASCGFDSVVLKSVIGKTGQVSLQFLPDTNPSNGITVFNGGHPRYQANNFTLFPFSTPVEGDYFAVVDFSNNDNVITMFGADTATGFQLCTGIFTKGAPPDSGGFVPASAEGKDHSVPSLPAN